MPRPAKGLFLLAFLGCGHSEPFRPGGDGAAGPFDPGAPVRLTYSAGHDRAPTWLPGGSGLLYVFQRLDHPDQDRCLGELPPAGGSRRREKCIPGDAAHDSVNVFETVAVDADGGLAWVEQTGVFSASFVGGSIRTGTLAATDRGVVEQTLPYTAPDGRIQATATHLGWLNPATLVYVGADIAITSGCSFCKLDTLLLPRNVMRLDRSLGNPEIVPGTDSATSVWPLPDGATIAFTLGGQSRVLQEVLAGGAIATLHDFGGLGIARDVVVRDSLLIGVVGGAVTWAADTTLVGSPFVQRDGGGVLYAVNLNSGVETPLSGSGLLVRHPALSPDGRSVVAEMISDTLPPDLYLFELP